MTNFKNALVLLFIVVFITNTVYAAEKCSISILDCSYDKLGYDYEITYYNDTTEYSVAPYKLLMVNGDILQGSIKTINDRTLVPVRVIGECLNAQVSWLSSEKKAVITRNTDTVSIVIGNDYITLNDKQLPIDTSAMIIDDLTYVPLRAISEALNMEAGYYKGFFNTFPVVWLEDKTENVIISPEQAVTKAVTDYYNQVITYVKENVEANYNVSLDGISQENFENVLSQNFEWLDISFQYTADIGRYYFIQYTDNGNGILVDKYTGDTYSVFSFSLGILTISSDLSSCALMYQ